MMTVSSYGSWKSPISAGIVAAGEVGLEQIELDGRHIYWVERRAQEGGRKVVVRRSTDGAVADVTPAEFNARTRVHEYGGGDYAIAHGTLIFSNFVDQRLYIQILGSEQGNNTGSARRNTSSACSKRNCTSIRNFSVLSLPIR